MKKISYFVGAFLTLLCTQASLSSSEWTNWTESPSDPIYDPIPLSDFEDYFPYVVFNATSFDGNGDAALYKMWHQGADPAGSIALSLSNDGISWTLKGETNIPPAAYHPVVVYDKNGFGVGGKPYRIWFWTGVASTTTAGAAIHFSQSNDGITWDPPQPITEDPGAPLIVIPSFYFFQLYGPGFVIYNPNATSIPGRPYTFPYVMYYDIATSVQQEVAESIALAYSSDGLNWFRFGSQPILIPSGNVGMDWDATHHFRPSVIISQGVYHMFYSGSNQFVDPLTTVPYAHGIGHASSLDGITWVKDADNPIFIYSDGVAWRNTRTYTPFVLFSPFCDAGSCPSCVAKMWFTGGTGLVTGANQGIGYATLPCPPLPPVPPTPAPLAPLNFFGTILKNKFLTQTQCVLRATWEASPSADVVLYRIYFRGRVVQEIPATAALKFTFPNSPCSGQGFEIAAVNAAGMESAHVVLCVFCSRGRQIQGHHKIRHDNAYACNYFSWDAKWHAIDHKGGIDNF